MRDSKMPTTAKEQAQVAKDYGPMRHIGEKPIKLAVDKDGGRGWDGNKGSKERTDKVPDKILPHGVVE